jgi:hypothetical protein
VPRNRQFPNATKATGKVAKVKSFFTDAGNSSIYHGWETPRDLAELLSNVVEGFDLDPCAASKDADLARVKAKVLLTIDDDGLNADWFGKVFCNPPYGRTIRKWMRKCTTEATKCDLVVGLVPARTDTGWWHDNVKGHADIWLLQRRLKFGAGKRSAPFPSAIVVWNANAKLVERLKAACPDAQYVARDRDIRARSGPEIVPPQSLGDEWAKYFRVSELWCDALAA